MKTLPRVILVLLSIAFLAINSQATIKTWNGTASTAWSTASNWTPSGAPGNNDQAVIPMSPVNQPVLSSSTGIDSLTVNSGAFLTISAGTLTIRNAGSFVTIDGTILITGTGDLIDGSGTQTIQINSGGLLKIANSSSVASTFEGYDLDYGSTIEYGRAGNQTVASRMYGNLVLSGSGTKSLGGDVNVYGKISMQGTSILSRNGMNLVYGENATLEYKGSGAQSTGQELLWGTSAGVIVDNPAGVTLTADVTLNGPVSVVSGNLVTTEGYVLTLCPLGTLLETPGHTVIGNILTTRDVLQNVNNQFGGIGVEINAAGATPGSTTVLRVTGTAQSGQGNNSIKRYFVITPAVNSGLNATMVFHYDDTELNGNGEADLGLFRSHDGGATWVGMGSTNSDITSNTVTLVAVDAMHRWTAASESTPLPIQLATFTAVVVSVNKVRLNWSTLSETNNFGFEVQRSARGRDGYETIISSFVPGHGTTLSPHQYVFIDETANSGFGYYRLKQIDLDGTVHFTDGVQVSAMTGVNERAPREFALLQNYPNPFNPETQITFSVEQSGRTTLRVYNAVGQEVATLFDEFAEAGQYYTAKLNGMNLASGLYFYKLDSGTRSDLKKMVLLK